MLKIRIGMIGAVMGSLTGNVPRIATEMGGVFDLRAGVFLSDLTHNRDWASSPIASTTRSR